MKNKLFKLTALWMVGFALVSCQHDVDVFGISTDLALNNMPGYYTFTVVDSATMIVSKTECYLEQQEDGVGKGYYRESVSGMCTPTDEQKPITWDAVLSEDKLSMVVTLTFEDGTTRQLNWRDGVLQTENKFEKTGASNISALNDAYTQLTNMKFEATKKTYYDHIVKVDYLAWKTKVDGNGRKGYTMEEAEAKKAEYESALEPYKDTIVWYFRTQLSAHRIDHAYLDSIIDGTDTTYVVKDMVYIDPEGKHPITYLISETKQRDEQINDRPEVIEQGTIVFNRAGEANTGNYSYRKQTWTEKYYTDPGTPEAITTDSTYSMQASAWAITSVSSQKKFDVLLFGTEKVNNEEKQDKFATLKISDYDAKKGEMTVGTLIYKLKQ